MPVASSHRFLYGESPLNAGKRIWVISGSHLQDWFFHNQFHGCVALRRTLELWALEEGVNLTVTLRRDGSLDFSGNPDQAIAEQMFSGAWQRRPPKYGSRPGVAQANTSTNQADENTEAQAQQIANGAQNAAGGSGQALLNVLQTLRRFLSNSRGVTGMVIIEDLPSMLDLLATNNDNSPHLINVEIEIQQVWTSSSAITTGCLVAFLDPPKTGRQTMRNTYTDAHTEVAWKTPGRPKDGEVLSALERLSIRRNITLVSGRALAKVLAEQESKLSDALRKVLRLHNKGENIITVGKILDIPPLNEARIQEVKDELNSKFVGLANLKKQILQIEQNARNLRRDLEEGKPYPDDVYMHLVFQGNPGTGKTEAANLVARLFNAVGLVKTDRVIDGSFQKVMSSNRNETSENLQKKIEEARGGVLFIDEAYRFGDKDSMDAKQAADTLLIAASEYKRELVIILAGYENRMPSFWALNEGLPRRFPEGNRITFADYTLDELMEIFNRTLGKKSYSIDLSLLPRIRAHFKKKMREPDFGNAGEVITYLNGIIETHNYNEAAEQQRTFHITPRDLPMPEDFLLQNRFANAFDLIRTRVLGQDHAIRKSLQVLRTSIMGLKDAHSPESYDKPRGVLFFAGPTGVGKTELAQAIASVIFQDKDAFLRIDMSNYKSEHHADIWTGAPPGYTGYEQGGLLTEKLKKRPSCVLLFDEIEKAHPSIFDKFLQILDGRLSDGQQKTVSFGKALVIFTSNLGVEGLNPDVQRDELEETVISRIEETFRYQLNRPELLGRIGVDNVVVFNFMTQENVTQIVDLKLGNLLTRLRDEQGVDLKILPDVRKSLIEICCEDLTLGARDIGNKLQNALITPLANNELYWSRDPYSSGFIVEDIVYNGSEYSLKLKQRD